MFIIVAMWHGRILVAADKQDNGVPGVQDQLPFTFPVPASYREFIALLRGPDASAVRPRSDQLTILSRMVACNNVKLAVGNREHMCRLFDCLTTYATQCAGDDVAMLNELAVYVV